ncbi:hypothetical protein EV356DRAFT_535620 [Viridothelium virens]|uniref:Uncharacterized protein n=1 Tax=Viridothelium virens TaxID=1048519 RepID=A0A6A6H0J0_VIRVR|nr:hypothetical protein EV356DRAFT_535620 [Viridothelium virens]
MPSIGRGGAGNMFPNADSNPPNRRSSPDLEASTQTASSSDALHSSAPAPPRTEEQYKTMGRGGAGNWYSPSTLEQTGTFSSTPTPNGTVESTLSPQNTDPSSISETQQSNISAHQANAAESTRARGDSSSKVPPSHFPAYVGRGGAGNYTGEGGGGGGTGIGMSGATNPWDREIEMQQMRVTAGVEEDVERELSRPPRAHLGEGKIGVARVGGN